MLIIQKKIIKVLKNKVYSKKILRIQKIYKIHKLLKIIITMIYKKNLIKKMKKKLWVKEVTLLIFMKIQISSRKKK